MKILALDEQNKAVRTETFGALTTDGSTPKHNNRVVNVWLSDKGKSYVLDGKRGMATDVNSDVAQPVTTQSNWTGSFISPDIEKVEKDSTIGKGESTIILKNGESFQNTDTQRIAQVRIRKLTPKECWRLMGFTDTDFDKAAEQLSNSRLYKCAGNSIVVDVLKAIFGEML